MNRRGAIDAISGYLFLAPYLALFAVFLVLPLLSGLGLSLFQWELVSPAPARFVGLENYGEALRDKYFWRRLGFVCERCRKF
jgi:multiple sugar transport system permease protein